MKLRHLIAVALLIAAPMALASTGAMSLIPRDAVSVGVVHVSDMRSSPLLGMLFQQTDKVSANGDAERFLTEAGLQPKKDIDLLVVSVSPKTTLGHESKVLVAVEGRFSVDRVVSALTARGAKEKKTAGGSYFTLPDAKKDDDTPGAVAFPDASLALIGDETSVSQALADRAAGGTAFTTAGGLARELGRIDSNATAWALVDVARASRLTNAPHIENKNASAQQISAALNHVSTVALWATDTGDELKLGAFGLSNDAETLQLLEDTLRGGLAAMRLAVQDKQPELVTVLRKFDVKHTNDSVMITGTVPAESLKKFAAHSK
ncbi:MAG TPA: hypothetical protein VJ901_17220 [Thermoanaerobaculia bacterium]|nr:hypothetical protein [Thermoanaerobaculia bacterium]